MKKIEANYGERWELTNTPSHSLYVNFLNGKHPLEIKAQDEQVILFTVLRGSIEMFRDGQSDKMLQRGDSYGIADGSEVVIRSVGKAELIEERTQLPDVPLGEEPE